MSLDQLNPKVRKLKIGKRIEEEVEILPLSFTDQRTVLQTIVTLVVETFPKWKTADQTTVITDIKKIIEDNIELIVEMVYDGDKKDFLSKLTNDSLIDLIEIIWEVNYELPLGKGTMTVQKILTSLKKSSSTPSPQSVNGTDTP